MQSVRWGGLCVTCVICKMHKPMTVSDYIRILASASRTEQHEALVECLEYFGLYGTQKLTLEQVAGYWELFVR